MPLDGLARPDDVRVQLAAGLNQVRVPRLGRLVMVVGEHRVPVLLADARLRRVGEVGVDAPAHRPERVVELADLGLLLVLQLDETIVAQRILLQALLDDLDIVWLLVEQLLVLELSTELLDALLVALRLGLRLGVGELLLLQLLKSIIDRVRNV